jgi:hypothetical protein
LLRAGEGSAPGILRLAIVTNSEDRAAVVRREIEGMHAFFEQWLPGQLPDTEAAFARVEGVLAPDFALVDPAGHEADRATMAAALRGLWNTRPQVHIWIEEFRLLLDAPPLLVARYEEWQEGSAGNTVRVSTAIFRADPAAPNGVQWVRVHETWVVR